MIGFLLTAARVLLGLLVLAIGVLGRWDQTNRKAATEGALATLAVQVVDGIPTVSADHVTTEYDGQPVFLQGDLQPGTIRDPLTGLEMNGFWMKRLVELRQWEERADCESATKSSTRSCNYYYSRVWSRDLIDSDNFAKPLFGKNEHVNPGEKPIDEPAFFDKSLKMGAWSVDTAYFAAAFPGKKEVSSAVLESAELADDWRAEGTYLYNEADADLRVRYDYRATLAGYVSLIAIPEKGTLSLTEELASLPLLMTGDASPRSLVERAGGQVPEPQVHWIFYTFFGLMILIRPIAKLFSGLNDFTYAPIGKRIAMTAGVAAMLTMVVGVTFSA